MQKIYRKSLLYKTGVEYGDYAINHISGCSHGCRYPCYAYMMNKRFGKVSSYDEWINPKIVENAEQLLEKEILKYKEKIKYINICFTTDPFMYDNFEIKEKTLRLIEIINRYGIIAKILTKGILPKSLINFSDKNEYGITLVSLDEKFRIDYEPNTSKFEDRINALKYLHENNCKTWVSIEPYPTPNIVNQKLINILEKVDFVDKIVFGKMNYNKLVSSYREKNEFYKQQVDIVKTFCDRRNIEYYIKKGTIKNSKN